MPCILPATGVAYRLPMSDKLHDKTILRVVLAGVTLVTALGLLALTVPRFQASVAFLPVDAAVKRYFREREIPVAQLDALKNRADEAIAHHPHYRYFDGLSFLNYLEAQSLEGKPWLQRPALVRSLRNGEAALARAPAKPRTWLRVARARAVLDHGGAAVAGALKMSFLTGRVEPPLMLPRIELGYRYLEHLDPEGRALLRDQTLLGWRMDERSFRRALTEGRLDLARIEAVLGAESAPILAALESSG